MRSGRQIWVAAAALLAGCGTESGQDGAQQGNAAAPVNAALGAQPVKEEHRRLELTPAWLVGRWQTGGGDCGAGDTFFTFSDDGRYTFLEEQGRWSLAGDQLTIEVTEAGEEGGPLAGERTTTTVAIVGPNEAEFRAPDGAQTRVFRCHEG